jgi:hypothetical protein
MIDSQKFIPQYLDSADGVEAKLVGDILFLLCVRLPGNQRIDYKRQQAAWSVYADWLEDAGRPIQASFIRKYAKIVIRIMDLVQHAGLTVIRTVRMPNKRNRFRIHITAEAKYLDFIVRGHCLRNFYADSNPVDTLDEIATVLQEDK